MRKTQMNKTQKTAIVGGTVVALAVGGVAFAAWTSTGTGTGSATATDSVNSVIGSTSISNFYPTGSFPTTISVTNPNPYKIAVTNLKLKDVSVPSNSSCNANEVVNAVKVTSASVTQFASSLAANSVATAAANQTPATVSFSNDLNDACKNVTITLNWTADASSTAN